MREHRDYFNQENSKGVTYVPFVESEIGHGKGLIYALAQHACGIISDEFPVFIIREHNERVANKITIPFITIDSNGIIPLGITDKDPYSAYLFRKVMQKHLVEALRFPPVKQPLLDLEDWGQFNLPVGFNDRYVFDQRQLDRMDEFVSSLPINHEVAKVNRVGTRAEALERMNHFVEFKLARYDEDRNHPDQQGGSGLSPWLHFGKISSFEIVERVFSKQPLNWRIEDSEPNGGKNSGFFRGHSYVESFLDELITWREVGFQFAHHRSDYDRFDSLPDWAKKTMIEHDQDPREYVYSLEELAQSKTHDPIWNAAQTELRSQGVMHNYLRMLWGKKIIEWTGSHEQALDVLIELNNRYALDGRDPNSYSGIFWCLGRFDRAWQERTIFGKLRYMSSDSTSKKIKLKQYLQTYGSFRPTS
jgi:deoxyribodipyrimidine photo-lyase